MRVHVRVRPAGVAGWTVTGCCDLAESPVLFEHTMGRLADASGAALPQPAGANRPAQGQPHHRISTGDGEALRELMRRIDQRRPEGDDVLLLGRWLFDALTGRDAWGKVKAEAARRRARLVELALEWPADAYELHRLPWEMMHDGQAFLAVCRPFAVAIIRIVPVATEARALSGPPRVLFVVGSSLSDPQIRPGAEFMGLIRELEREGGMMHPYVLQRATIARIADTVARFRPDVVHFVGHGRVNRDTEAAVLVLRGTDPARPEYPDHEVSATEFLAALSPDGMPPAIVVLSACDTGRVGGPHTASIAADLVSGGVPVVVAMAGRVSDAACRLFTRRFGRGLVQGEQLAAALAAGRRAAFTEYGPAHTSVDWGLPAIYQSRAVPPGFAPVVDRESIARPQRRAQALGLFGDTVFCGRRRFFDAYEELLDPAKPATSLVGLADGDLEWLGSNRLLRELGAQALRDGHLPCMVGPFAQGEEPRTPAQLAVRIVEATALVRERLGLGELEDSTLLRTLAILSPAVPGSTPLCDLPAVLRTAALMQRLAEHRRLTYTGIAPAAIRDPLRRDLGALIAAARAWDGSCFTAHSRVLVLLSGVQSWHTATDALFTTMLDAYGLGSHAEPVPVIMTAARGSLGGERLQALRESARWTRWEPLRPLGEAGESDEADEDILAYQWILLHPTQLCTPTSRQIFAALDHAGPWRDRFRQWIRGLPANFPTRLYLLAQYEAELKQFTIADDEAAWRVYLERQG
ncbi:MAG: CHAT domain-containing protein [Egibacteraceae bacterium]